jgi:hypothetical protein
MPEVASTVNGARLCAGGMAAQAVELEERARLLYKTKAAIEGLQSELNKARENEEQFKEQARVAFEEQGESDGCPCAIATVPRPGFWTRARGIIGLGSSYDEGFGLGFPGPELWIGSSCLARLPPAAPCPSAQAYIVSAGMMHVVRWCQCFKCRRIVRWRRCHGREFHRERRAARMDETASKN